MSDSPRTVGRYAMYASFASGGMAQVHLGRLLGPVGFSRTVAIKRAHDIYARDPDFVAMLLDEARLTSRVRHPNVVQTLDVVAESGELFIVMEYVHGQSLARLLAESRGRGLSSPVPLVATICAGALHGLHAAHEACGEDGRPLEIVHRDVSPQNVLVGADGVARMLDFGIARARNRVSDTRDGRIKGKFRYMSVEQIQSQEVTARTDVYAMGVVLWEALAAERYIDVEDPAAIVATVLAKEPTSVRSHRPDVPEALDRVLLKALARAPEDRFASAREMALAIEAAAGIASNAAVGDWVTTLAGAALGDLSDRIAAIEDPASARPLPPSPEPSPESPTIAETPPPRSRPVVVIAAGIALAVVALVGWRTTHRDPPPPVVVAAPAAPSSSGAEDTIDVAPAPVLATPRPTTRPLERRSARPASKAAPSASTDPEALFRSRN